MVIDSRAVWDRLRAQLSRPPADSPPVETLRWVRRCIVAILPLDILVFLLAWASGAIPLWVAGAVVSLTASAPITLTRAIRTTEKEAAKSGYRPPAPDEVRRRERRAHRVPIAVLCVSMPVAGYLVGGLTGAAVFLALALLSSGLSLWWQRRFWDR